MSSLAVPNRIELKMKWTELFSYLATRPSLLHSCALQSMGCLLHVYSMCTTTHTAYNNIIITFSRQIIKTAKISGRRTRLRPSCTLYVTKKLTTSNSITNCTTVLISMQNQCFFVTVWAGTVYRKIWRLDNNLFARIIRLTVQKFQIECFILFCFILQVNWSDRRKCDYYPFSIFLLKFQ